MDIVFFIQYDTMEVPGRETAALLEGGREIGRCGWWVPFSPDVAKKEQIPLAIENSVVFFPCRDIQETDAFYRGIVGLRKVQEQSGGICRIYDTGYGYWGFCQYGDGRPIPGGPTGVCLSLNCRDEQDVDRLYEEMKAKGAPIASPPQKQANFPVYAFFLWDPNGYRVEFQRILLEDQQLTGGRKER